MRAFTNYVRAGLVLLVSSLLVPPGQPSDNKTNDFQGAKQSRVVTWQMKRLAPPSTLYVGPDDVLRAASASRQTNEVVTINYRLLRASDGVPTYGQFTLKPTNSAPAPFVDQPLAEGFLLSASASAAVATTRGQTFMRLTLNPKALGVGQPAQVLMADYVTTANSPAYPNGRVLSPVEGPGWVHAVQQANPSRGVDWGFGDGANQRRRLISVSAVLSTSANAGNRIPRLQVLDNLLNVVAEWTGTNAQTPSVTAKHVWSAAPLVLPEVSTDYQVPLPPDFILPVGWTVQVVTNGLDANPATGDVWSSIFGTTEEWIDWN